MAHGRRHARFFCVAGFDEASKNQIHNLPSALSLRSIVTPPLTCVFSNPGVIRAPEQHSYRFTFK